MVDDASPNPHEGFAELDLKEIRAVRRLILKRNLGHQRAIAIGIAYIHHHIPHHAVLVMDGDGEDSPADVPRLFAAMQGTGETQVVFAERTRRSEGFVFTLSYTLYRHLHFLLTNIRVRFGNFCILPAKLIPSLMVCPDMWNHFASAILKCRLPFTSIPTTRGMRLAGQSKMNFSSLLLHGLSAFSVHGEIIGIRMFISAGILSAITVILLITVLAIRCFTQLAIPGWASVLGVALLILLINAGLLATVFSLFALRSRSDIGFIPTRDYHFFFACDEILFEQESPRTEGGSPRS